MMRPTYMAALLASTLCAAVVGSLYVHQERALKKQVDDLSALKTKLEALAESSTGPQRVGGPYALTENASPRVAPPPPIQAAPPPPDSRPRSRPTLVEQTQSMQTSFDMDRPPSRETLQTLRGARKKLNDSLPTGASVDYFDCHESLCRLEASRIPTSGVRKFESAALDLRYDTKIMDAAGIFVTALKDPFDPEMSKVVAYMATPGHTLPDVE